jgi:hypothetical protein
MLFVRFRAKGPVWLAAKFFFYGASLGKRGGARKPQIFPAAVSRARGFRALQAGIPVSSHFAAAKSALSRFLVPQALRLP